VHPIGFSDVYCLSWPLGTMRLTSGECLTTYVTSSEILRNGFMIGWHFLGAAFPTQVSRENHRALPEASADTDACRCSHRLRLRSRNQRAGEQPELLL
jgi:hypothetical protein